METESLLNSNGQKITAFKGDYITRRIKRFGLHEHLVLSHIRNMLTQKEGLVTLDIGANIGNHSLDFSTYSAQVYSFEPVEQIYTLLKKNVQQNGLVNVHIFQKALSDSQGVSRITLHEGNMGASCIDENPGSANSVEIQKVVGDPFIKSLELPRVDFIKIDVEGHEINVISGLIETIKKFKPLILMEWSGPDGDQAFPKSPAWTTLMEQYDIKVLGNNTDKQLWHSRRFAKIRRLLTKIFVGKKTVLYEFLEAGCYRNILLTPKK